jgi:hypothetical protein
MKKLLGGVKRAFASSPPSQGSSSHSNDSRSQDSPQSSSFVSSPHESVVSSCYLAHDDVPEATNSDDISIHTIEEMEKYKSLHYREFAHTRMYDVNLLERVGLDKELPTILRTTGWGKLYDDPRQGLRLLTLEFLTTFETVEKGRMLFVKFCLFRKSFGRDLAHFSELLYFSKSCLLESTAMRNFNKVEFSDTISRKSARLRFSDIHHPSLKFLHRWMSFMLFPMVELCSVTTTELKCMFAMVNRIKYISVADIVNYFTNVSKILGQIECTSLVTRIAMNLRYSNLAYIEGVYLFLVLTILFTCTSCARNLIILYPCCMVIRQSSYLTWPHDYILVKVLHYSLIGWERHATTSLDRLVLAARSYGGSTTDHDYTAGSPSGAQCPTGYGGGYSGHHESGSYYPSYGYPEPSP